MAPPHGFWGRTRLQPATSPRAGATSICESGSWRTKRRSSPRAATTSTCERSSRRTERVLSLRGDATPPPPSRGLEGHAFLEGHAGPSRPVTAKKSEQARPAWQRQPSPVTVKKRFFPERGLLVFQPPYLGGKYLRFTVARSARIVLDGTRGREPRVPRGSNLADGRFEIASPMPRRPPTRHWPRPFTPNLLQTKHL